MLMSPDGWASASNTKILRSMSTFLPKVPVVSPRSLPRLSTEARNTITIENDENSWGIEASLELRKHLALVLDIHPFGSQNR